MDDRWRGDETEEETAARQDHWLPSVVLPAAPVVAGVLERPEVNMVESKPRPPAAAAAAARSCAPASATAFDA